VIKRLIRSVWVPLFTCVLVSCGDSDAPETTAPAETGIDHGELLATVDGIPIYEMELDELLLDMFGEYRAMSMDEKSRRRALDSLIASRALAKEAEARLDTQQLEAIETKTRKYRENLLINTYMRDNVDLSSINDKAVTEYYEKNPDLFGKKKIKQYRMLSSRDALPEDQRNHLISAMATTVDMSLEQKQTVLSKAGIDLQLSRNEMNKNYLDSKLYAFIDAQQVGRTSDLTFIRGKPYVVEVLSERELQPRPLIEVKETIRKSLVLARLKEAIKKKSAQVLAKSSVIYNQ
jgi:hypothetical protein